MNRDTQIVETVSGTWLRFPNHFKKFQCLVELSDQLSLNINLKSGSVHVHQKDDNDVFQYIGDLYLSPADDRVQCSFVSSPLLDRAERPLPKQSDAS